MKAQQISRDFVLGRVTEAAIFEFYLGVPVRLDSRGSSKPFRSPIRPDRYPTCVYFTTRWGTLYYKDRAGYFTGDCFRLVEFLYGLTFNDALRRISYDMKLIKEGISLPRKIINRPLRDSIVKYATIGIKPREWNLLDRAYWRAYFIRRVTLMKHCVFPVDTLVVNGHVNYMYDKSDPAYAYYFGEQKFKIYWPRRKKYRFLCNTDKLQRMWKIYTSPERLFITKSMKDVMVLYEMGHVAVAPQGEGHTIPEEFLTRARKAMNVVLLYDNDAPGKAATKAASERYDLDFILIPEDTETKDISDYVKSYGLEAGIELIENLLI